MAKLSKRILIADDDPIYRDIAAETLEKSGHKITLAADGGEAIALLTAQSFDAAIIDLTMPVADGISVIQTLRKSAHNATIPVIVITGHDDAIAIERAYQAGATSFLTKPLNWLLFTPHVEFVLRCGDTESELREASATAAYLSDLKSQMMAALAQEFQTPIKTIFGFSQLIEKEVYGAVSPPAYKDMLTDIARSARNLNTALLKVMDFGRALTEHLKIEVKPVNAHEAVLDAVGAFETQAQRRGLILSTAIDLPPDLMVLADPALFSQALRGILDNAVRLSPSGGEVAVIARIGDDGGLAISVRDKGPALPETLVQDVNGRKVAPKFSAQQPQSSDVSIRIAKILAQAHRGHLNISSGTLAGNTVSITLPVTQAPAVTATIEPVNTGDALQRLARISAELADDPRFKDRVPSQISPARQHMTALGRTR